MKLITNNPPPSPTDAALDDLAREASQNDAAYTAPPGGPSAEDQATAQAMAAIELGTAKVLLGLLKAARAWLSKKLPEIQDEWTDEVLKGPSDAAVPLVKKHLETLMQIAGANPELAVFAFSLLPLVMGYVNATEKHNKKTVPEAAPPTANHASD